MPCDCPHTTTAEKDGRRPSIDTNEQAMLTILKAATERVASGVLPSRGSGVEKLLQNNRNWAENVKKIDPEYFTQLSKQQTPQYLWIGCSDSRVPANQVLGLAPGEVFVHRNIANVVSRVDLNCLSVVQFAVEVLKVEHVIVCGHYNCGGVKAANTNMRLGLVDNWIMNVVDIKNRYSAILDKIPAEHKDDALSELNVICQVRNVVESTVMQDWWKGYRKGDRQDGEWDGDMDRIDDPLPAVNLSASGTPIVPKHNVEVHGWVYGLKDGLVVPLIKVTPRDDLTAVVRKAFADVLHRYTTLQAEGFSMEAATPAYCS
jgi:carbonic anhydrase